MASFFSTLILGLIAAVIGAAIQQRTWRHRSLEELREKERAEARQAVEVISEALDLRLEAQRTYTERVLTGSVSDDDIKTFKEATTVWMGGYSTNLSRIYHSFGKDTVREFEFRIQDNLQYASAVVRLGRVHGPNNLGTRDRRQFLGSGKKLSLIQHDVHRFLNELNDRISMGQIGRTQEINNLAASNPHMISRLYLIRRLLGMEGNISSTYWYLDST